jgi:hypothetical protein
MENGHIWSIIFDRMTIPEIIKARQSSSALRYAEPSTEEYRLIKMYERGELIDYLIDLRSDQDALNVLIILNIHDVIPEDSSTWFDVASNFPCTKTGIFAVETGNLSYDDRFDLFDYLSEDYDNYPDTDLVIEYVNSLGLDYEDVDYLIIKWDNGHLAAVLYPMWKFDTLGDPDKLPKDIKSFYYTRKYGENLLEEAVEHYNPEDTNSDTYEDLYDYYNSDKVIYEAIYDGKIDWGLLKYMFNNGWLDIEFLPSDFAVKLIDHGQLDLLINYITTYPMEGYNLSRGYDIRQIEYNIRTKAKELDYPMELIDRFVRQHLHEISYDSEEEEEYYDDFY